MEAVTKRREGSPPAPLCLLQSSTTVQSKTRCESASKAWIKLVVLVIVSNPGFTLSCPVVSDGERSVCQTADADQRIVWRQSSCYTGTLQHATQVAGSTVYCILHSSPGFLICFYLKLTAKRETKNKDQEGLWSPIVTVPYLLSLPVRLGLFPPVHHKEVYNQINKQL